MQGNPEDGVMTVGIPEEDLGMESEGQEELGERAVGGTSPTEEADKQALPWAGL